jgi:hypothetical protein
MRLHRPGAHATNTSSLDPNWRLYKSFAVVTNSFNGLDSFASASLGGATVVVIFFGSTKRVDDEKAA